MKKKEIIYTTIGILILIYQFAIIRYVDLKFATYFSFFILGLTAIGFILRLKHELLNTAIILNFIFCSVLIVMQIYWITNYGIKSSFTYQNPSLEGYPFWIHIIDHTVPIILSFVAIFDLKTKIKWKNYFILMICCLLWCYTMDSNRFLKIPSFYVAFPIGIPIITFFVIVYNKIILPKIIIKRKT